MPQDKPEDWVDRRQALSVPFEVVLQELLPSTHVLARKGENLQGWCPIGEGHGKKDSFGVNVVKGVFNCYACKKKGNVIDFVMAFNGVPFKTAAQQLINLANNYEEEFDVEPHIGVIAESPIDQEAVEEQRLALVHMTNALVEGIARWVSMRGIKTFEDQQANGMTSLVRIVTGLLMGDTPDNPKLWRKLVHAVRCVFGELDLLDEE